MGSIITTVYYSQFICKCSQTFQPFKYCPSVQKCRFHQVNAHTKRHSHSIIQFIEEIWDRMVYPASRCLFLCECRSIWCYFCLYFYNKSRLKQKFRDMESLRQHRIYLILMLVYTSFASSSIHPSVQPKQCVQDNPFSNNRFLLGNLFPN